MHIRAAPGAKRSPSSQKRVPVRRYSALFRGHHGTSRMLPAPGARRQRRVLQSASAFCVFSCFCGVDRGRPIAPSQKKVRVLWRQYILRRRPNRSNVACTASETQLRGGDTRNKRKKRAVDRQTKRHLRAPLGRGNHAPPCAINLEGSAVRASPALHPPFLSAHPNRPATASRHLNAQRGMHCSDVPGERHPSYFRQWMDTPKEAARRSSDNFRIERSSVLPSLSSLRYDHRGSLSRQERAPGHGDACVHGLTAAHFNQSCQLRSTFKGLLSMETAETRLAKSR